MCLLHLDFIRARSVTAPFRQAALLVGICLGGFGAGCALGPSPTVSHDNVRRIAAISLLTNSGQFAQALAEFQACWREIPSGGPGYGIAHSLLLRQLARLAVVDPPANTVFDNLLHGEADPGFDTSRHGQLAEAYAGAGRAPDALREYLWCIDHTGPGDIAQHRAVAGIGQLGRTYPPAREEFARLYPMLDPDSRQTALMRRTAAQLGIK